MKARFIISALVMLLALTHASAKNIFVIEGPEETYNQVRVVNETSQSDFSCRIVILNEDETTNRVYGTYNLRGFKSSDTNTDRFPRGTKMAIQMEKDFPEEWSFYIEYKDFPLFDAVIVHLRAKSKEFNEE